MRFASLLFAILASCGLVRALEPIALPSPLLPPPASGKASEAEEGLAVASAERAQALGFPSLAVSLYRSMLAEPGADRPRLTLLLSGALLDEGDASEAAKVLEAQPPPRNSAWHLRAGLVAAELRHWDAARTQLAAIHASELEPGDESWSYFLQGLVADAGKEAQPGGPSAVFYQQAVTAAVTDLQRARFLLAEERVRLRVGSANEAQLEADRRNAETYQGKKIGYSFAREYAVALNAAGRRRQAVEVLQNALHGLPGDERAEADRFRLLAGLIAGANDETGRRELFQLLESGSDPDQQRIALLLLARSSTAGAARTEFHERLDALIGAARPSPILENLLLCRAELSLGDPDYAAAEDDAHALLEKFPGSSLKANAYGILARSAWAARRYRTAADCAFKARALLPPGLAHAEFGVVVAEAWFRAGLTALASDEASAPNAPNLGGSDFRSAADAYAAALADPPSGIRPGQLMFQRVEAEIRASERQGQPGALSPAVAVLNDLERDPAFDAADRWKAEWNLSRALELNGETTAAYDRVNRLLAGPSPAGVTEDLRARMAWLQARLSLDAQRPEETLRLTAALAGFLGGLGPDLKKEIAGSSALLRAQACFLLGRDADALESLKSLRARFPGTDPAVYSYLVEAEHYANHDEVVQAQQLLVHLATDYPASSYAPYALYQAALQSERLGQDKDLREADTLIETLVTKYPASVFVFYARLREGDLLRKLNQFPQAQRVYELLVNDPHSQTQESILAQLALAECHGAQAADDPSHAEAARRIFEDLVERVDATPDIRVEAGYNLGHLLDERGAADKALEVWWTEVVDPFLVKTAPPPGLGARGRWWMARTLLEAGAVSERRGRLEEAQRAWQMVVDAGLPGEALARERLARFHLPAVAS